MSLRLHRCTRVCQSTRVSTHVSACAHSHRRAHVRVPPVLPRHCPCGPQDAPSPWRCPGNTAVAMATTAPPSRRLRAGIGRGVVRVTRRASSDWTVGMVQSGMGGSRGAVTGPGRRGPLETRGPRGAVTGPGRRGPLGTGVSGNSPGTQAAVQGGR